MPHGAHKTPKLDAATGRVRSARQALHSGVCIALLALLAQLSLPHLHAWLANAHAPGWATAPTDVTRAAPDGEHHGEPAHADPDCATCQALAQTRSFLASHAGMPHPVVLATERSEPSYAPAAHERVVAHAPRSPPAAA